MVPHAGERLGMKHLPQEGSGSADHHPGNIGMHPPGDAARWTERIVARPDRLLPLRCIVEETDHAAGDGAAELFRRSKRTHPG